jgi:hypothetical protein
VAGPVVTNASEIGFSPKLAADTEIGTNKTGKRILTSFSAINIFFVDNIAGYQSGDQTKSLPSR